MKEITIIKQLIKSFNKGRANIWKFKDLIINHNIRKPDFIPFKPPSALEKPPSMSDTVARLSGKASSYGKEEFKEISSKAFFSSHVRELFTTWETNPDSIEDLSDAVNEVIENLKNEYPRLQKWDNIKIIKRISDNWADRVNIQIEQNKRVMEYTKATDLKERENENPGNDIKIDDTFENNDILDS